MVGSRLAVTARRVATIPRRVAITAWPHAMILWPHSAIARRLSIVATRLSMIDRRLADTKYGFFAIKRARWPNSTNPAMARQNQISEGEEVADRRLRAGASESVIAANRSRKVMQPRWG